MRERMLDVFKQSSPGRSTELESTNDNDTQGQQEIILH